MKTMIIGYGHLGKIYAEALLQHQSAENLLVLCKTNEQAREVNHNGHGTAVFAEEVHLYPCNLLLLSVKPQDAHTIYATARKCIQPHTLVLSVMAGINLVTLAQKLEHHKIIRALPNIGVKTGQGATGYTASAALTTEELLRIESLLTTTGLTLYFKEEHLLNAVTALSGSGPAYFFYTLQCMIDAGKEMGFTEEVATQLVEQTMLGAYLVYKQSGKTLPELIRAVASRGGTTEAAFAVFEKGEMKKTWIQGIQQACTRAEELSRF